ncbi:hypothetical protein ACHAWF_013781 [Thalassiosira exigua]
MAETKIGASGSDLVREVAGERSRRAPEPRLLDVYARGQCVRGKDYGAKVDGAPRGKGLLSHLDGSSSSFAPPLSWPSVRSQSAPLHITSDERLIHRHRAVHCPSLTFSTEKIIDTIDGRNFAPTRWKNHPRRANVDPVLPSSATHTGNDAHVTIIERSSNPSDGREREPSDFPGPASRCRVRIRGRRVDGGSGGEEGFRFRAHKNDNSLQRSDIYIPALRGTMNSRRTTNDGDGAPSTAGRRGVGKAGSASSSRWTAAAGVLGLLLASPAPSAASAQRVAEGVQAEGERGPSTTTTKEAGEDAGADLEDVERRGGRLGRAGRGEGRDLAAMYGDKIYFKGGPDGDDGEVTVRGAGLGAMQFVQGGKNDPAGQGDVSITGGVGDGYALSPGSPPSGSYDGPNDVSTTGYVHDATTAGVPPGVRSPPHIGGYSGSGSSGSWSGSSGSGTSSWSKSGKGSKKKSHGGKGGKKGSGSHSSGSGSSSSSSGWSASAHLRVDKPINVLEPVDGVKNGKVPGCVDRSTYRGISADVWGIGQTISNIAERVHYYGAVIRLAAHDAMDCDLNDPDVQGPDGCVEWDHPNNGGLSTVWHRGHLFRELYEQKYSDISRADFWVMSAEGVMKHASGGGFDLEDRFLFGRPERDVCSGSGDRVPTAAGCHENRRVFLDNMGLDWTEATALMGGHTMGKGHSEFSGHDGLWMPNYEDSMKWDNKYYLEMMGRAWWKRENPDPTKDDDWTTGDPDAGDDQKMMLNTDLCFAFDSTDCCSRTDLEDSRGNSHCLIFQNDQCPVILMDEDHPRMEAAEAVMKYINEDNDFDSSVWYEGFATAWGKAATCGRTGLQSIRDSCDE